jgi:hypothetical protein
MDDPRLLQLSEVYCLALAPTPLSGRFEEDSVIAGLGPPPPGFVATPGTLCTNVPLFSGHRIPILSLNPLDPIEFGIPQFLTMSLVFSIIPIFMPVPLILESSFQTLKIDNHPF